MIGTIRGNFVFFHPPPSPSRTFPDHHCASAGRNCEIEINECETLRPCKHGAKCKNRPGSYECDCSEGYRGRHCEIADCQMINCTGAPCLISNDSDGSGTTWTCDCAPLGPFVGGNHDVGEFFSLPKSSLVKFCSLYSSLLCMQCS